MVAQVTKRYVDHTETLARQNRAIEEAREILKGRGIVYPIVTAKDDPNESYGKLLAYGEQEAALIVEIIRRPAGGERPLTVDKVEKKENWRPSWYD
jgi:hypothetical protein